MSCGRREEDEKRMGMGSWVKGGRERGEQCGEEKAGVGVGWEGPLGGSSLNDSPNLVDD